MSPSKRLKDTLRAVLLLNDPADLMDALEEIRNLLRRQVAESGRHSSRHDEDVCSCERKAGQLEHVSTHTPHLARLGRRRGNRRTTGYERLEVDESVRKGGLEEDLVRYSERGEAQCRERGHGDEEKGGGGGARRRCDGWSGSASSLIVPSGSSATAGKQSPYAQRDGRRPTCSSSPLSLSHHAQHALSCLYGSQWLA